MRPSRLDTIDGLKEEVAKAYAEGATQNEIAEIAGVKDRGTVAEWLKRSDIQALVSEYIKERSNAILRHTDTKLEKKLEQAKNPSFETLLKIRREFAGQQINLNVNEDTAAAHAELLRMFHEEIEKAEALKNLDDDSA